MGIESIGWMMMCMSVPVFRVAAMPSGLATRRCALSFQSFCRNSFRHAQCRGCSWRLLRGRGRRRCVRHAPSTLAAELENRSKVDRGSGIRRPCAHLCKLEQARATIFKTIEDAGAFAQGALVAGQAWNDCLRRGVDMAFGAALFGERVGPRDAPGEMFGQAGDSR